jgi:phospholipid N-methyltransferase
MTPASDTMKTGTEDAIRMPSQAAKKAIAPSSAAALFARNFFKYPSMLGSIVPSSPFLVKDIMAQIDWDRARVLVEFGPGVGTITRKALKRMRHDALLVVIELNADFVQYLQSTILDPRLRVVHGSAADVRRILAEQGLAPADYIISSLPYSLLREDLRREIVSESRNALKSQGSLLVFQYNRTLLPYLKSSFSSVRLGFQLFNILPALIFHCTP